MQAMERSKRNTRNGDNTTACSWARRSSAHAPSGAVQPMKVLPELQAAEAVHEQRHHGLGAQQHSTHPYQGCSHNKHVSSHTHEERHRDAVCGCVRDGLDASGVNNQQHLRDDDWRQRLPQHTESHTKMVTEGGTEAALLCTCAPGCRRSR